MISFTLSIQPQVELESTGFIIKITQATTTIINLVVQLLDQVYQGV